MRVSIVVPVYQGAETVPALVDELARHVANKHELDLVLVDDASPDDAGSVCEQLAEAHPWISVVHLARNFGEHNAVMAGLHEVRGDKIVIMDDDLQNPPSEVDKLLEAFADGYDVVYARYSKKRHSWFRNLLSALNGWMATLMLGKPRSLYLCSFKALDRFVVEEIKKYDGPFPYIDGLILRVTRNIGVVNVEHSARAQGRSGYTLRKLFALWANMFTSFSILPLRLATMLGLLVAGLGMLGAVLFIIERLRDPSLPVGWASLVVSVLVLAGVQLFALGMVGEYLGRLFLKSTGEPQFVVRSVRRSTDQSRVAQSEEAQALPRITPRRAARD